MTSDSLTASRASRALEVANATSKQASERLDLIGFVTALRQDPSAAVTEVAREAVRADRLAFKTMESIVGYLEDQADLVASSGLLETRFKIESTGVRPNGREARIRLKAGLPAILMMAAMDSMRDGVSPPENDTFCQRVGTLMERVGVKPADSARVLDDVLRLAEPKHYVNGAAKALAGVGMTLEHARGIYDQHGERRKAGPASIALDVIGSALRRASHRDQFSGFRDFCDMDIQRALAAATAEVVRSPAYAAEYIDPAPIMDGASDESLAKARKLAKETGVTEFAFTLTNMLAHHGIPEVHGQHVAFPADSLAALSMAGHNGISPVPGFPRYLRELDLAMSLDGDELPLDVRFESGQTPRSIVDSMAKRMLDAPVGAHGEFEEGDLRRLTTLMEMRSRAGDLGVLKLFEPVVKVMASRGQSLLYDACTDRPALVKFLLEQGHGNIEPNEKNAWRQGPVQSLFDSIVREPEITGGMASSMKLLIAFGADFNKAVKASVRRQYLSKFIADANELREAATGDFQCLQFTLSDRLKALKPLIGSNLNQVKVLIEASQARDLAASPAQSQDKPSRKKAVGPY